MRVDDHDPADRELVARARQGDGAAFDRLLARHGDVAYRVALGIVHDPDQAADAVQDAFLKVFRKLDGFRGEARFRTWFLSIVVNEARGGLRKTVRRRELSLDEAPALTEPAPDPAAEIQARAEAERARAGLASLPEKQRLAVQLRVDEGLSFREVGAIIGSSEGAARVNYHHGIRRLREMLQEET